VAASFIIAAKAILVLVRCFSISVGLTILFALGQPHRRTYSLLCGDLVFCAFVLVPLGLQRCRAIFLAWARSVDNFVITDDVAALRGWYSTQMKFFEGSGVMLVAGLGLACAAEAAFTRGHYFGGVTGLGKLWAQLVVFVAALFAGCRMQSLGDLQSKGGRL